MARLDLDEAERSVLPCDDVHFPLCGAVVRGQDIEAEAPQRDTGKTLPPTAELQMGRPAPGKWQSRACGCGGHCGTRLEMLI
jgi:hypothetical protein